MPELSPDCHFKPILVYRGGLCPKSWFQEEVICLGWRDLFGILSPGAGSGSMGDAPAVGGCSIDMSAGADLPDADLKIR